MKPVIKEAIDRYANEGRQVGGFLTAVLSNDLTQAIGRADEDNIRDIKEIVAYCYYGIPGPCWGSPEAVAAWIEKHRAEREAKAQSGEAR